MNGIPFGPLRGASIYLEGSYTRGTIQLYHHDYKEVEFWTDLAVVAEVPDAGAGVWDCWASKTERNEGEFQMLLEFHYSRGYLYSNDPLYDGNIRISISQDWMVAGGDIVTDSPMLLISEAWLIVPEPGAVVLLGFGALMLRRKRNGV